MRFKILIGLLILLLPLVFANDITPNGNPNIIIKGAFGEHATCDAVSCYFDVNITNNYAEPITIYPDNIAANDDNHKSNIRSSNAFKEEIVEKRVLTTRTEERIFKCPYPVSEKLIGKGLNATTEYKCEDPITKEDLFRKNYKEFDPEKGEFKYDEQVEVEVVKQVKEKKKEGITLTKGETATVRIDFTVPINAEGKFDVTLDVYIDGELVSLVYDPWYDNSVPYRQEINLYQTSGATLTNYQVRIALNDSVTGGNFNWSNNGDDLRFTNSGGDALDFWVQTGQDEWDSGNNESYVWVEVDSIPNGTNTTIYMYYGNTSFSSASDGDATFIFFDDFTDASLNATKWSTRNSNCDSFSAAIDDGNDLLEVECGDNDNAKCAGGAYTTSNVTYPITITAMQKHRNFDAYPDLAYSIMDILTCTDWTYDSWCADETFSPEAGEAVGAELHIGGNGIVSSNTTYPAENTWFESDWRIKSGASSLDIKGEGEWLSNGNTTTITEGHIFIGTRFWAHGHTEEVQVDWIGARAYAADEPVYFIGDEEDEGPDEFANHTTDNYWLYFCAPDYQNTSWTDWYSTGACFTNDTYPEERNLTEYDANDCIQSTNTTFYESRHDTPCNYCSQDITGPTNTSCNETDQLVQYYTDNNYASCCAVTTIPDDCEIDNGSYDNQTFTCDFCTPNPTNTTWTDWLNETTCQANNTRYECRNRTEHDANSCYSQTGLPSDDFTNITYEECDWRPCSFDEEPPIITIHSAQDTTIGSTHLFNISTDETTNCTLNLNDTYYDNFTSTNSFTWYRTALSGNYTTIEYNCTDAYGNSAYSAPYWLFADTFPPIITITWSDANSTIDHNDTTVTSSTNELASCTLHFNGTSSPHAPSFSQSWSITDLPLGNYSTINITCLDAFSNSQTTSNMWLNVTLYTTPPEGPRCTPGDYEWLCWLGIALGDFFGYLATSFGYLLIYLAIALGTVLVFRAVISNVDEEISEK
jgi:hypothetical protein